MVMLATSEAAREYWQSDAIEFVQFLKDFNHFKDLGFESIEELYKEFIKQKQ